MTTTILATQSPTGGRTVEIVSALASLIRTARAISRQHHQQLGASGTPLTVLKSLHRRPGQDRPGDLAQAAGVAPSVMSRVLARLEEDGLVTRHRDELDARACHMVLTDAGRAQLESIEQEYTQLLEGALAEVPPEDVDRMPGLLQSLEEALLRAGATVPGQRPVLAPSLSGAECTSPQPAPIHESR
jgi:DNA-binding MarR family transcriptional regulator